MLFCLADNQSVNSHSRSQRYHIRTQGSQRRFGGGQFRFHLHKETTLLLRTDGVICLTCEEEYWDFVSFFYCPTFQKNFDSIWCDLLSKVSNYNTADGIQTLQFLNCLDRFHRLLLLLGCRRLPFEDATVAAITKFLASVKIYKFRTKVS